MYCRNVTLYYVTTCLQKRNVLYILTAMCYNFAISKLVITINDYWQFVPYSAPCMHITLHYCNAPQLLTSNFLKVSQVFKYLKSAAFYVLKLLSDTWRISITMRLSDISVCYAVEIVIRALNISESRPCHWLLKWRHWTIHLNF